MEDYLSPSEVAKLTKLSKDTVYHYIKKGDLPATRLGRKHVVLRSDLEGFIEARKGAYQAGELHLSDEDREPGKPCGRRSAGRAALLFHLGTYVIVNGFLVLIWLLAGGGYPWFLWVIFGWGILLVMHAFYLWEWKFFMARGVRRKPATVGLIYHTHAYLMVNSALVLIWALAGGGYPWFLWAVVGWGIGLALHALSYFSFSCAR